MKARPKFKSILAWPGGECPQNWMTPRTLDLVDAVERSTCRPTEVRILDSFSIADLRAGYKAIKGRKIESGTDLIRRTKQTGLITLTYRMRQVPAVCTAIQKEIEAAANRVRVDPPARRAWRGPRHYRFLLPLSVNQCMPVEARLRDLLEVDPSDIDKAIARNTAYRNKGAGGGSVRTPEAAIALFEREAVMTAALALHSELAD